MLPILAHAKSMNYEVCLTCYISNITCVVLSGLQFNGRDIVLLGERIHRLVHLEAGSLAGI